MSAELKPATGIRDINIADANPRVCDICGKLRGYTGTKNIVHTRCSEIRRARGFKRSAP